MKLLVFAHTPPPHHGQSYMVKLMLDGLGGDHRGRPGAAGANEFGITCYHVNARVSKQLEDIGDLRIGKLLLLLAYCLQAIWCRFRYGVDTFYYIPAPGKHSALYRDWLVMFVCRRFFRHVVLHWHAAGLAKWLETTVQIRTRSITFHALKGADLSIVLSNYNRADAEKLFPHRITIVSNGLPDPCPGFDQDVLPRRRARHELRARLLRSDTVPESELHAAGNPRILTVAYLAHCMREKGVFDAIAAVRLANRRMTALNSPISFRLLIGGNFVSDSERAEFDRLMAEPDVGAAISHLGFVSGERKDQLLRDADLFCFPTWYQNENQPVNLIEAMAYGLPIVTTRWRSVPEMFPENYSGLVDIRMPDQIADALIRFASVPYDDSFRRDFLRNYNSESYIRGLADAFKSVKHSKG